LVNLVDIANMKMRFSSLVLFSPLVAANVGNALVNFDPTLEGRVNVYYKVVEVIGHIHTEAQFSKPRDSVKDHQGLDTIDAYSLLGRRGDLNALLGKRQYSCRPGYGYCEGQ
jgi:hypothetical protein